MIETAVRQGPWRVFIVNGGGEARAYGPSWALDAAMDIVLDAGMDPISTGRWLMAAERVGRDPEDLARRLVAVDQGAREAALN